MKLMFYSCWLVLLYLYLGMRELSDMNVVQSLVGPMDIFLAVVVPVGFSLSIIRFMNEGRFTFKGTLYSLGFLLVFTLSQLLHGMVGSVTSDAVAMTQGPPIEEMIARLVDQALVDHDADQGAQAAALLYLVSGVKTMYKSEDHQYKVFTPTQEQREERIKWKSANTKVETMKGKLLDQAKAISHRTIFHLSSFFVLFSATFLFEIHRPNSMSRP